MTVCDADPSVVDNRNDGSGSVAEFVFLRKGGELGADST